MGPAIGWPICNERPSRQGGGRFQGLERTARVALLGRGVLTRGFSRFDTFCPDAQGRHGFVIYSEIPSILVYNVRTGSVKANTGSVKANK